MYRSDDLILGQLTRKARAGEPRGAIENRVCQLLQQCNPCNVSQLPVEVLVLARCRKIQISATALMDITGTGKARGILTPVEGGFKLVLAANLSESARNMTIAHEIGHTFFYDDTTAAPHRRYGLRPTKAEEDLCEFAARTMLLPRQAVEEYVRRGTGLGPARIIVNLARVAKTTLHATVARIMGDLPDTREELNLTAVIMWTPRNCSSSHEQIHPKWFAGEQFIPLAGRRHAKAGSAVHRRLTDRSVEQVEWVEDVSVGKLRGTFRVDLLGGGPPGSTSWVLACYRKAP